MKKGNRIALLLVMQLNFLELALNFFVNSVSKRYQFTPRRSAADLTNVFWKDDCNLQCGT